MPKKKQTFAPLHWNEHTDEEKIELEKQFRGEASKYDPDPREEIIYRIDTEIKHLSEGILEDMQYMIDAFKHNIAQFVILRKKTKEKLKKTPKDLSYSVLDALKGRKS